MDYKREKEFWEKRERVSKIFDVAYLLFNFSCIAYHLCRLVEEIIEKNTGWIIWYSFFLGLFIVLGYFQIRTIRRRRESYNRAIEILNSLICDEEELDDGTDKTDE
jgi:hypothetical protein